MLNPMKTATANIRDSIDRYIKKGDLKTIDYEDRPEELWHRRLDYLEDRIDDPGFRRPLHTQDLMDEVQYVLVQRGIVRGYITEANVLPRFTDLVARFEARYGRLSHY